MTRLIKLGLGIISCLILCGCFAMMGLPSPAKTSVVYSGANPADLQCAVYFKRSSSMLGKARNLLVIDLLLNAPRNAIIGKTKEGTVMFIWIDPSQINDQEFFKIQGLTASSLYDLTGLIVLRGGMTAYRSFLDISPAYKKYQYILRSLVNKNEEFKHSMYFINPKNNKSYAIDELEFEEVTVIAQIKAGELIDWKRPAGSFKIALISPPIGGITHFEGNRNECTFLTKFDNDIDYDVLYSESEDFVIESGKDYFINHDFNVSFSQPHTIHIAEKIDE